MAIGDDLMVMLGLVPVRDRAGIARGTMATEAQAAAAASPNAEGRALVDQGARPPDFELPSDIPTAFAGGKQRAAPYGGPSVIPQVLPPSQDRVVASGPAAAPSTAVRKQNSDIMLEAYQRQAQQQKMQQIIASIGMIANGAFNRNPDSQSATGTSLAGMLGGGGGGAAAAGGGMADLKALLEMRDAEALERQTVPELQRMFGWSEDRARAAFRSGEYKNWLNPQAIQKREEDSRAARVRMDLAKPDVVAALAKKLGVLPEVVQADIANGKIGAKEISDILSTQATTTKTGVETREKAAGIVGIEEAQSTPAAVAERYRKMGYTDVTEDVIKSVAGRQETLDEFNKNHQPLTTGDLRELKVENDMREAKGLPKLTPSEFKRKGQQPHIKEAGTEAEEKEYAKRMEEIRGQRDKANAAKDFIEVDNEAIGRQLADNPKLLLGPFSEKVLEHRRFFGDLLKMPSEAVKKTDVFKASLREYGLKVNDAFKGNFSDKDQKTVNQIIGVEKYTQDTLKNLIELREKHKLLEFQNERKKLREGHADPVVGASSKKFHPDVPMPKMSTVMRERFDKEGGEATALEFLSKNRDNPKALNAFDREWGAGRAEDLLSKIPTQ